MRIFAVKLYTVAAATAAAAAAAAAADTTVCTWPLLSPPECNAMVLMQLGAQAQPATEAPTGRFVWQCVLGRTRPRRYRALGRRTKPITAKAPRGALGVARISSGAHPPLVSHICTLFPGLVSTPSELPSLN